MSRLVSRNISTAGRRTTMRLEPELWDAAVEICHREDVTMADLVTRIDDGRSADKEGRTSAVRVYILAYFRTAATDASHQAVGHGLREKIYA